MTSTLHSLCTPARPLRRIHKEYNNQDKTEDSPSARHQPRTLDLPSRLPAVAASRPQLGSAGSRCGNFTLLFTAVLCGDLHGAISKSEGQRKSFCDFSFVLEACESARFLVSRVSLFADNAPALCSVRTQGLYWAQS